MSGDEQNDPGGVSLVGLWIFFMISRAYVLKF